MVAYWSSGLALPWRLWITRPTVASSFPRSISACVIQLESCSLVTFLHSTTIRCPMWRSPVMSPRSLLPVFTRLSIRSSTYFARVSAIWRSNLAPACFALVLVLLIVLSWFCEGLDVFFYGVVGVGEFVVYPVETHIVDDG